MIVRDEYWEMTDSGGDAKLKYIDAENAGKREMDIFLTRTEVKSLYRLLRRVYD